MDSVKWGYLNHRCLLSDHRITAHSQALHQNKDRSLHSLHWDCTMTGINLLSTILLMRTTSASEKCSIFLPFWERGFWVWVFFFFCTQKNRLPIAYRTRVPSETDKAQVHRVCCISVCKILFTWVSGEIARATRGCRCMVKPCQSTPLRAVCATLASRGNRYRQKWSEWKHNVCN